MKYRIKCVYIAFLHKKSKLAYSICRFLIKKSDKNNDKVDKILKEMKERDNGQNKINYY